MMKHIIGQVLWQCLVIFTLIFAGEYIIPESDPRLEWPQKPGFVHPGRASDYISSDVYSDEMARELGPSRHMTFVFSVFIFMQVSNMICARRINDELNIFEGIASNFYMMFVVVLIIIS